jgi:hypothetical protein
MGVPVFRADGSEISMFEDLVNHVMQSHTRAHDQREGVFRKGRSCTANVAIIPIRLDIMWLIGS